MSFFEPRKTWYVTFELPKSKKAAAARNSPKRASESFLTEDEAKAFACEKYKQGLNVRAGTLNPHLPRRMISFAVIYEWIGDASKHSQDISKIHAESPVEVEPGGCAR
jgi:hypothetical protein